MVYEEDLGMSVDNGHILTMELAFKSQIRCNQSNYWEESEHLAIGYDTVFKTDLLTTIYYE